MKRYVVRKSLAAWYFLLWYVCLMGYIVTYTACGMTNTNLPGWLLQCMYHNEMKVWHHWEG